MGNVQDAIVDHAVHLAIWRRFQALPERFNWKLKVLGVAILVRTTTLMLWMLRSLTLECTHSALSCLSQPTSCIAPLAIGM
jgi:hypothetical protein